ncbi:hypothetical protein BJX61DRAFT_538748 [Aspergillus egyptiacus]|nr:hypothetical protein BJX61DRAFT_538748 [Aspergillus egyptiacus]
MPKLHCYALESSWLAPSLKHSCARSWKGKEPSSTSSIVAVHGLNPKNKERHAERTWELNGKLWLRDLLPTQLPQARILLFGYNSSVSIRSSSAGVREQAQNLLSRLWLAREGCESRPIIFIAHSLGGILVKEALVQAKLGVTFSSIRMATYGIVFFGTPHRGSHLAKLGETVAKAVRAFLRSPSNTFINALKEDDLYANELSENFQQLLEDYKYINFYETLPLRSLGLIVEKKSATLGLPDSREMTVAVAGDHESICRFASEEDENYKHISALITRFAAIAMNNCDEASMFGSSTGTTVVTDESGRKLCMLSFDRNPGFVDRAPIFDLLRERTLSIGRTPRVALYGLGGVGKSQIAIEFAHQLWIETQTSVFWVSANSLDRFREGYHAIFDRYISPGSDGDEDKLARVKDWLEKEHDDWMLIIDNADETSLFETSKQQKGIDEDNSIIEFLPTTPNGVVLITTRNRAAGVKFTQGLTSSLIEVKPMTGEESKHLIKNSLTDHILEESEMHALSDLLGYLPLAIVQAAAFIEENSMSVSEYMELYDDSDETRMDLLCEPFETLGRDTGVPNAVATTMILSLDRIKDRDSKAFEILSLIAFLDRNNVPKSLIQHRIKRPLDLTKALGTLKAFSLIAATDGKGNFSVHRLVQLVLRKWLIVENRYEQKSIEAMELVDEVYPDATFENWGICATYLPHAQSVLSLAPELEGEARRKKIHLQEGIAYYFWSQGYYKEAEKLDVSIVEEKKREFGPEHPETLESIAGLAATYHDQARLSESEKLDMFVLEARRKTLGPGDRLTLTTMANLATTYESQGRLEEAEKLRLDVYATSKSAFGLDDDDTAAAMTSLGSLYIDLGKLEEAVDLIGHALGWRSKNLGPRHKDSLTSMSILSRAYKAQGKLREAEKLALEAFEASQSIMGERHPQTRIKMTNLADIYLAQGNLERAEMLYLQMIEELEQENPTGYTLLEKKLSLADIYREKGDRDKVEKREREALSGSLECLGFDHPFTLRCLYFIAITHKQHGRDSDAIQLMTHVAHKEKSILGADHQDTLQSFHMLTEWCGEKASIQDLSDMEEGEALTSWSD